MLQPMPGRTAPTKPGPTYRAILAEVKRQGVTGYALAKRAELPLSTMQRFLSGEGSPTITSIEAVAKALGMAISVTPPGN